MDNRRRGAVFFPEMQNAMPRAIRDHNSMPLSESALQQLTLDFAEQASGQRPRQPVA
jgi:hypothetical protein